MVETSTRGRELFVCTYYLVQARTLKADLHLLICNLSKLTYTVQHYIDCLRKECQRSLTLARDYQ